jgi:hypothetical protein
MVWAHSQEKWPMTFFLPPKTSVAAKFRFHIHHVEWPNTKA